MMTCLQDITHYRVMFAFVFNLIIDAVFNFTKVCKWMHSSNHASMKALELILS